MHVLSIVVCGQAMPAHSLVLRPNGAETCSLILEYHLPSVPSRAPLLVVDIESPRVLALLRWVHHAQHAQADRPKPMHSSCWSVERAEPDAVMLVGRHHVITALAVGLQIHLGCSSVSHVKVAGLAHEHAVCTQTWALKWALRQAPARALL